jgi:ATP-dependent Clp protease adaptor protein ClpS
MMEVHQKGRGLCGVYPYEIAETKVHQVGMAARENKFPLKAQMEEA